ncbi:MAG: hypothetical protein AMJ62_01535 [Myxococcales bacterium SG8_38]|nr:MAG: hypothetical protein AMJ62_01535 [Myxococcales bacterium SG8_38]
MPFRIDPRLPWFVAALCASLLSGCIFVGEYDDDFYEPRPKSYMYETCYSDVDCYAGNYCEELALPADRYTEYVNAICTVGCFDDLDCPFSEFNALPGACIDHVWLGGPVTSRICVERCIIDADCDVASGFGCELIAGERLCVPVW